MGSLLGHALRVCGTHDGPVVAARCATRAWWCPATCWCAVGAGCMPRSTTMCCGWALGAQASCKSSSIRVRDTPRVRPLLHRVHRPPLAHPSQMMRAEVTKYNKRFGIVKVAATGYVGEDLVVEAELTLAMAKQ